MTGVPLFDHSACWFLGFNSLFGPKAFSSRIHNSTMPARTFPLLAFLLLTPIALPLAAARSSATNPAPQTSVTDRAEEAEREQNFDSAIALLQPWVVAHPNDFSAHMLLGEAYRSEQSLDNAENEFLAAHRLKQQSFEANLELGSVYNAMGRYADAVPVLRDACELRPASRDAKLELSIALARLRRYSEAAEIFRGVAPPSDAADRLTYLRLEASIDFGNGNATKAASDMEAALRLRPDDENLILATAIAESQAKRWKEVIRQLAPRFSKDRSALAGVTLLRAQLALRENSGDTLHALRELSLDPSDALELHLRLGQMLSDAGLHSDAADDFRAAADLAPERAEILFDLALEEYRAHHDAAALADAKRALDIGDSADLEDLLGDIEEDSGDFVAAAKSYQSAVAASPHDEKYRLVLGLEFLKHENFDPAVAVFQQTVDLFPESAQARTALGMSYFLQGQFNKAADILVQAARMRPPLDLAFRYLGITQFEQPYTPIQPATDLVCRRAEAQPPDHAALTYCGALTLRRAEASNDTPQRKRILSMLGEAERLDPDDALPRCQRGEAYAWLQEWESSRKEFEACIQLQPESPNAHYRLSRVYQHLGLTDLAQKESELHEVEQKKVADENGRRDAEVKTFLYDMQGNGPK